jgi:protein phosphatase
MTQKMGLEIGHRGDPGRQRDLNEDSYLVLTPPILAPGIDALIAVADGMGGHQAGDVASQALVEDVDRLFCSSIYQEYVAYSPGHPDYYVVVLKEVLEQINEHICDLSVSHSELKGMGTTATVLLFAEGNVFWGHVGDSRAYLMRNGDVRQLTRDHTWVAEQVAAGSLTWEEASRHPRRHQLTQSLGNSLLIRVERGMRTLNTGDVFLLCTDGLTNCIEASEIQRHLLATKDLQAACDRLVDLANERGGPDNITVVAARWRQDGGGPNLVEGRIVGPVKRSPPSRNLSDTLKIRRKRSRGVPRQMTFSLGLLVLLLFGALVSAGLVMLLQAVGFSPIPLLHLAPTTAALMFLLGAFLGWTLRSIRSRIFKEEKDEK